MLKEIKITWDKSNLHFKEEHSYKPSTSFPCHNASTFGDFIVYEESSFFDQLEQRSKLLSLILNEIETSMSHLKYMHKQIMNQETKLL
jgi:hypothetical protein